MIDPVTGWHTSSYSGARGECVEVNETSTADAVLVRDTENRGAGFLAFPGEEWSALLRTAIQ